MTEQQTHQQIAEWLDRAQSVVAFTGAGISTESGIPDFRSPGGIWSRSQPVMYQDFLNSAEARREYWRQKSAAHADFAAAEPNDGHRVLARWESQGRLDAVITQNIDGLHQVAGGRKVLELHGTARRVDCLDCPAEYDPGPLVEAFLNTGDVPVCGECGGRLKHATISFGQSLPPEVLQEAIELTRGCDLFLAMGSSLVVEPAASLPRLAHQSGAKLVIINREKTERDDQADAIVHAGIGATLLSINQSAA